MANVEAKQQSDLQEKLVACKRLNQREHLSPGGAECCHSVQLESCYDELFPLLFESQLELHVLCRNRSLHDRYRRLPQSEQ